MHPSAYNFVKRAIGRKTFEKVLDIGSLDVNSTAQGLDPRTLVKDATYYGIDTRDGAGVNKAVAAADYDGKGKYDLVISTEAMEHTKEPRDILDCAWRALQGGGLLILTAAGPTRAAHGVDGGDVGKEHYANVDPGALQLWLEAAGWEHIVVEHDANAGDVYATARRAKKSE